jgi:phosphate transport system permease protein
MSVDRREMSRTRIRTAHAVQLLAQIVTGAAAALGVGATLFVIGYILFRGAPSISGEFLFDMPRMSMTQGGIWPAIVGTLLLTLGTAVVAMPVGVAAGIYLAEYAKHGRLTRTIRLAITNMAGVPSIVYGLFGLAVFVIAFKFGVSVLAGSLTLGVLTLPVVITATEEALRQVPRDLRQASLALGATKLRTIARVVLPAAAPGIVTGGILGLARAAGETAPILFTAVAFYVPVPKSPLSPTMALPYHLYIMATQPAKPAPHIVWGTALVLVAGVSIVNVAAAAWRSRQRSKIKW